MTFRLAAAALVIPCALVLAAYFVPIADADDSDFAQIEQGRYLTQMGDCAACHTREGGAPFSGGLPLKTPFGTIYASNITPDELTGIGRWSVEDFARLMREGIRRDGAHIYPAMPYQHFTEVANEDLVAIKAYLDTLEPVSYRPPDNALLPPLGIRESVAGWNVLFFKEGPYRPDPNRSTEWNRGAYLVEGLGHCGLCHTPLNTLGAEEGRRRYQGAAIENWTAPALARHEFPADTQGYGIAKWTAEDLATYLKTGSNRFAIASGPMAEVVERSTSHATDADLLAIAAYLKSNEIEGAAPERAARNADVMTIGSALFRDNCSACHGSDGAGQPGMFTDLRANGAISHERAESVLHVLVAGAEGNAVAGQRGTGQMPAFGWKLSDEQIAAVATYVRASFGNDGPPVAPGDVADMREALEND